MPGTYALSANLVGIPGISIPCGMSKEGLPVCIQLLGNHFEEETILRSAYALEQERSEWKGKIPESG